MDLLFWLIAPLLELGAVLFAADGRPAARCMALGCCGLLVLLLVGGVVLFVCLSQ